VEQHEGQAGNPGPGTGGPCHSIATWLRVDRDVVEGLHILRMSADPAWIVRKDLYIKLESLVHAQLLFAVDLDLGKIRAGLPHIVAEEAKAAEAAGHERPIWLPILRQPAVEAFSQRVSSAIDGNNQAVPIMRGADVRYRLAAALAWLFLSGCFQARGRKPRLGEIARLQLLVQQALYDYLSTGSKEALEQALEDDPTAPDEPATADGAASLDDPATPSLARQAIDELTKRVVEAVPMDLGRRRPAGRLHDGDNRDATYEHAFSQCLTYARTGRFVVIGLTPGNSSRVECHLIPTELQVSTTERPRRPTTALGFDLTGGRHVDRSSGGVLDRIGRGWREVAGRWHRPVAYHFQFPVPEVSLLDGSHVTIETDEDVAISPAVLFHDHTVDDPTRPGVWQAQAYRLDHWFTPLLNELENHPDDRLVEALEAVTLPDLRRTERALEARLGRLREAQAVLRTSADQRGDSRNPADREGDLPTITATRDAHQLASRLVATVRSSKGRRAGDGGRDPAEVASRSATALQQLKALAQNLDENPHLELTPDDDPREHVAHFHTAEARSITPRDRDRRPVVHGVLRASHTGATGYARMAALTCLVNAALLVAVGVLVAGAVAAGRSYTVDALVTLLLLVPGISATLLGRVPADTIRYVVLRRWASLVMWSLLWPAVAAVLLATLLDGVDRDGWPWLLWLVPPVVGGFLVALRAGLEFRRARSGFDPHTDLTGRIVPNHKGDRANGSARSASASYHRADVDTRVVLDVCSAGLFQANRPSRRFMVWVGLHDDQPGDFDQVVGTLEATTDGNARAAEGSDSLQPSDDPSTATDGWGWAQILSDKIDEVSGRVANRMRGSAAVRAERPELTIESSTCQAAAGSGAVMAIISGERHLLGSDRGRTEEVLAHGIVAELATSPNFSEDLERHVEVVVDEIDAAPEYFLYTAPRFIDTVFSVPPEKRNKLPWLIKMIWGLDERKFRVSYLHCPPGTTTSKKSADGERAVLKVGLAFDRGYEPVVASSLLELYRFADRVDGCRLEAFDRRAYPEPPADRTHPPADGYRAVAISSAGPGDAAMMRALVDELYPSAPDCNPNTDRHYSVDAPFRFVGGSIMTAGGYASRVFRFDVAEEAARELGPKIRVATTSNDDEQVTTWRVADIDLPEPERRPATFPVWLRWQLNDENLAELLAATRRLERPTGGGDVTAGGSSPAMVQLNLEYLNNRVNDLGQINGKARYRAQLPFPDGAVADGGDLADLDAAFRQALHASLQRDLGIRLAGNSTYMLVSDEEPRRPASSEERESEFNSY
jgi:hypothetical protein